MDARNIDAGKLKSKDLGLELIGYFDATKHWCDVTDDKENIKK